MGTFVFLVVVVVVTVIVPLKASIVSSKEPDWSIAKADLEQELHSYAYEPLSDPLSAGGSGRIYRSLGGNGSGKGAGGPLPLPLPLQMQPPSLSPKVTKFLLQDKKDPVPLPLSQGLKKGYIGPVYEHPQPQQSIIPQQSQSQLQPQILKAPPLPPLPQGYLPIVPPSPTPTQQSGGYNHNHYHDNSSSRTAESETQSIVWPKGLEQGLVTHGEETQLRFLVHKPGDEEEIKKALTQDGDERGQEVKFVEGPALRIQRHQKVYLPPKKKTVVYILLKEPQILTDVEVVGEKEEPVPEVFITYQKADGHVKTKHYTPEHVKGDKTLRQLHSDLKTTNTNTNNEDAEGNRKSG